MFEEDSPGQEHGLIRSERLDRLALRRSERGNRRSKEAHAQGLKRLASPNPRLRAKHLITLRFCCQGWCFAFIREGLQLYPIEHTRFSRPLAGEHWWHHPDAPHVLSRLRPMRYAPFDSGLLLPSCSPSPD